MLNWLVSQVNWIIDTVQITYNWIVSFVQNPYATLRSLLDWVYHRAIDFTNAVKQEIANWTWSLFQEISRWLNWFDHLYSTVIAPAIASIQNLANNILSYVNNVVSQVVNNLAGWISEQISNLARFVNDIWNFAVSKTQEIINWTYSLYIQTFADINWLKANIAPFNPADIWRKIEEIYTFIAHRDALVVKIVLDSLLDWLEEKLAEALE